MNFDNAARARIARGWLNSSLDQATYAAQHGISTRTLRDWVCRYGGGRRPQARLRAAILASIEQLQNVLAALDAGAAADAAAQPAAGQEVGERPVERRAGSAGQATPFIAVPVLPEPRASTKKVQGADASSPVHDGAARGHEREVAGPEVTTSEHVAVVDGTGPAAAPCRPAVLAAVHQQALTPTEGNGASPVLDLDALRKRAAQRRAARAASGGKSFFDWDAE